MICLWYENGSRAVPTTCDDCWSRAWWARSRWARDKGWQLLDKDQIRISGRLQPSMSAGYMDKPVTPLLMHCTNSLMVELALPIRLGLVVT